MRDHIVVKPDDHQSVASSILIVPQTKTGIRSSTEQLGRVGTVLSVGPGRYTKRGKIIPPSVKAGDRILWGEFEFKTHTDVEGNLYAVIQEADICGIIEE